MVLTSAAIKTILDGISFAETVIIFDHVQNANKRKFTKAFVEIENKLSHEANEDPQVTETIQRFLIHLYVRTKGAGTEEEARLSTMEELILTELNGATLGGSELFLEEKSWSREPRASPVQHTESILTVQVRDVTSTTGSGRIGATGQLILPGPITLDLLSKPVEDYGIGTDEDSEDDGKRFVTHTVNQTNGVIAVEYESTVANEGPIKTLIDAKAKISVTLRKITGDDVVWDVLLRGTNKPTQYDEIERAVLTMEITG